MQLPVPKDLPAPAADKPIIPSGGPYWVGDRSIVPNASTIKTDTVLSSISFSAAQFWAAYVGAVAAQTLTDNPSREKFAAFYRGKAWKDAFIRAHPTRFLPTAEGGYTADQFHVAIYCVPDLHKLAVETIFPPGASDNWFPLLRLGAEYTGSYFRPGYCYLALCPPGMALSHMADPLGPDPLVADIVEWFEGRRGGLGPLPFPGRFRARAAGANLFHLLGQHGRPGDEWLCLPGDPDSTKPNTTALPGLARLGADPAPDEAPTPSVVSALRGSTARYRITFATAQSGNVHLPMVAGLRPLVTAWSSVLLKGVRIYMTGAQTDSQFYVGISSAARRIAAPIGATMSVEKILGADRFVSLDATSGEAGVHGARLELPTERCDLELSLSLPPTGGTRPDLCYHFVPSGATYAVIEFEFEVSGGCLFTGTASDFFA